MNFKSANQQLIQALIKSYSVREATNISKILIEDLFGLFAISSNRGMSEAELVLFQESKERLVAGEPLQYVTGEADFYGLKFEVDSSVLIPRPETEEIVDLILKDHGADKSLKILDIGTGSGCIPIAIASNRPIWEVSAVDISTSVLAIAIRNAVKNEVDVNFRICDILDKLQWDFEADLDIVVSNPPYIPYMEQAIMRENVLDHEPHIALFVPDEDPLMFYKVIINFALLNIKKGGSIYFECNEFNGEKLYQYMIKNDRLININKKNDLMGKLRIINAKIH